MIYPLTIINCDNPFFVVGYPPFDLANDLLARHSYQPTSSSSADPQARLTSSLKQMIKAMSETTESFPPLHFLATLRQVAPQFAEESRHGGYAQQDADEMWTQTISSLHSALQIPGDSTGASFVDKYLATDLQQTLTCDEAPEEPPVVKTDRVFKLDCNISINTNYLISGIMDSFDQKIEKYSPSLGRTAVYTQKSRLTRLPANLTIHMVRFYWRADIQKKAKIMRKVKFPLDLDVLDLLTDDLQAKVKPINLAVKNVDKARTERAKLRKRTKKLREDVEKAERAAKAKPNGAAMDTEGDEERVTDLATTTAENDKLEDEETIREKERKEINALITENGLTEVGTNASALYELCGESKLIPLSRALHSRPTDHDPPPPLPVPLRLFRANCHPHSHRHSQGRIRRLGPLPRMDPHGDWQRRPGRRRLVQV